MKIGVPKETVDGERRVALVPDAVKSLKKNEHVKVLVERGAGDAAGHPDSQYEEAGAEVVDPDVAWGADVVLRVAAPTSEQIGGLNSNQLLVGHLSPWTAAESNKALAAAGVTSFAMEAIPRTTRAQSMDALSSQAVVAGYRATLAAARHLGKFFPMLITAAGTAKPSRVLVLGAGVAGLQAIATAKRLGAVVEAYDVRPAVKEEVESLGAKFVQIQIEQESQDGGSGQYAKELTAEQQQRQQELLAQRVAAADCVITTAAVPGRPAPRLVSEEMVQSMRPGSVIVDIAAETGGNCALTEPGSVTVKHGVTIDGTLNLPSQMPFHSSLLYANNVANLLLHMSSEGRVELDFEDEIVAGCCVTHQGRIVSDRVREAVEGPVNV